jgi:hypothetical protein
VIVASGLKGSAAVQSVLARKTPNYAKWAKVLALRKRRRCHSGDSTSTCLQTLATSIATRMAGLVVEDNWVPTGRSTFRLSRGKPIRRKAPPNLKFRLECSSCSYLDLRVLHPSARCKVFIIERAGADCKWSLFWACCRSSQEKISGLTTFVGRSPASMAIRFLTASVAILSRVSPVALPM